MKRTIVVLSILILVGCSAGLLWFNGNYVVLDGAVYSRSETYIKLNDDQMRDLEKLTSFEQLQTLDLRETSLSPEEYEQVQRKFPQCLILWKVALLNDWYDNTVTQLKVTALSSEDIGLIKYLPQLERVDAQECMDYEKLQILRSRYPHLEVDYAVRVGDQRLREDAIQCVINDDNAAELLVNLGFLPNLQRIVATSCTDFDILMEIGRSSPNVVLEYAVPIGGDVYLPDTESLTLENADGREVLEMIAYLPRLTDVTFTGTAPDNAIIHQMKIQYPQITFHWEFDAFGVPTSSMATELDLSGIPMENTDAVEDVLKLFYNLERVIMCDCGIPSEEMDALSKRHPQIRFVWTIRVGRGTLRTDAVGFIPFHMGHNQYIPLYDEDVKDLKYCVDLLCLDLGHMKVRDISFVQNMPKLKYLILVDMEVDDFSYIENLTELIFLELFQTNFTDINLLMNMKKLEDLNIAWTDLENPELLKEMTWLKRLWATRIGLTKEESQELIAAMPNTLVYTRSHHPTHGGWRQSKNYFNMRDLLGMFYLE